MPNLASLLMAREEDELARALTPFFLGGWSPEVVAQGRRAPGTGLGPTQISSQPPPVDLLAKYMNTDQQGIPWVAGLALAAGAEPQTAEKLDRLAGIANLVIMAKGAKGTASSSAVAGFPTPARIRPGLSLEQNAALAENQIQESLGLGGLLKRGARYTAKSRKEATKAVGGHANTSKLPCAAWGIPETYCKMGQKLRPFKTTPCYSCYASGKTGGGEFKLSMYGQKNVREANERRYQAYMKDRTEWVVNQSKALSTKPLFRWFDSGDLQSADMLDDIVKVAKNTPGTRHWVPTKQRDFVNEWLRAHPEGFPDNVQVRISLSAKDVPVEFIKRHPNPQFPANMLPVAGEYSKARKAEYLRDLVAGSPSLCPAPIHRGKCIAEGGDACLKCFSNRDVTYLEH